MSGTTHLLRIVSYFRKHDKVIFRKESWSFLWVYLKPCFPHLLPVMLGLVMVSYAAFLNLWLINLLFVRFIPAKDIVGAIWLGAAFLLFSLTASASGIWLKIKLTDIISAVIMDIRKAQMSAILHDQGVGGKNLDFRTLHSVLVKETDRLQSSILIMIDQTFPAIAVILALLGILAVINTGMLAVFLALLPIIFLLLRKSGGVLFDRITTYNKADLRYHTHLSFVLQYLDHIRIRATELLEKEQHASVLDNARKKFNDRGYAFALNQYVHNIIHLVIFILLMIWGSISVMNGTLTLGDLLILYFTGSMIFSNLNILVAGFTHFLTIAESLQLLNLNLLPINVQGFIGRDKPNLTGEIIFNHVNFSFAGKKVLEDISLSIEPGTCVSLAGSNGAGKTTMINLLLGFLQPSSGTILVDGKALHEIDMRYYRSSIGFVPQKPRLIPGTIMKNLTYGREGYSDSDLHAALRLAMLTDLVNGLQKGLETPVGEDGIFLSGGERQRIAIAGALLGKPRLLILDEPTNHLDAASILELIRNLSDLPNRPTILLVSHKEEVLTLADRVFVLEDGSLTEQKIIS